MDRPSAIDDRARLSELLDLETLEEIAQTVANLHGLGVAIREVGNGIALVSGKPSAKPEGESEHIVAFTHDGAPMADLVIGPFGDSERGRAEEVGVHLARLLDVLVHAAYTRHLTSSVHQAAMEENFAELSEKNRRLDAALEQLREVDRLKSNFLATVSHELRTPLTSVIGYAEMLLEGLAGDLGDRQREFVETILGKADHLLQLISGLLDVSLLEARSLRIEREPVCVLEMIERVRASLAAEAHNKGVSITIPTTEVPRAWGDPRKIRQVLLHLVANAIKFSPDGGDVVIEIDVGTLSPDDPGLALRSESWRERCGIRVRVSDTGIGIQQAQLARIFEPFFQADSSTTREFGGTGLGLSLAKLYVEAHGGHIWVDSTLGKGSTFTVTLPAVAEELRSYVERAQQPDPGSAR